MRLPSNPLLHLPLNKWGIPRVWVATARRETKTAQQRVQSTHASRNKSSFIFGHTGRQLRFFMLFLLFSLSSRSVMGQNLVVNPSFESFADGSCVNTGAYSVAEFTAWHDTAVLMEKLDGWLARTTPDAFSMDTCGRSGTWNNHVPANSFGYRTPLNGRSYAGFVYIGEREFITGTLSKALVPNRSYQVSFHVCVANASRSAARNIQMVFHKDTVLFTVPFSSIPGGVDDNFDAEVARLRPITFNSNYINNPQQWLRFEKYFTADSAYRYFTIGNFHPTGEEDAVPLRPQNVGQSAFTYFYLDQVSVIDGSDTISPPAPQFEFGVRSFPNPSEDWMTIEFTRPASGFISLQVTDVLGRLVWDQQLPRGPQGTYNVDVYTGNWSSGRYHISAAFERGGQVIYRHAKHQITRR